MGGLLLFCGLTIYITEDDPQMLTPSTQNQGRIVAQLLIIVAVIGFTAFESIRWHGLVNNAAIPLWTPLVTWIGQWGARFLTVEIVGDPYLALVNPFRYVVVPLLALLLLGANRRELGFRRGHRSWRVILLWCAVGLAVWTIQLFSGQIGFDYLRRVLIANLLQNGFAEEFLFRGALQTRLARLMPLPWALTAQAVIFAIWHVGAGARLMDGDILAGMAVNIILLTGYGLAYGIIFWRTRSLIACSVVHASLNAIF
jgi:membrane protease YdiL (CAAX protease family)